eukprot:15369923-Heterocapsa_arctica.AAC.1
MGRPGTVHRFGALVACGVPQVECNSLSLSLSLSTGARQRTSGGRNPNGDARSHHAPENPSGRRGTKDSQPQAGRGRKSSTAPAGGPAKVRASVGGATRRKKEGRPRRPGPSSA